MKIADISIRRKLAALPESARYLAVLDGEEEDERELGRIFGEELPSGLVLASDDTLASLEGIQ